MPDAELASITVIARRLVRFAAYAWLGCLALAAPLQAQTETGIRGPANVPPSWVQFSKLLKYRFEELVAADDAIAGRFRIYLWAHAGASDGPPPSLLVQAWVNPDGTVKRVAFPPLGDAGASKDLTTLLTRCNVGESPPPDILQPIRLRFNLAVKSTDKPPTAGH